MRKFLAAFFAIVSVVSIPHLLTEIRTSTDQAEILGYCLFTFGLFAVAVYFWRSSTRKDPK